MMPGVLCPLLGFARAVLSRVFWASAQFIIRWAASPPTSTVDTVLDAIWSLEQDDTVPKHWLQQLSLDSLFLSTDLRSPEFIHFLRGEAYQRYLAGGMLHDLLASTLLAREALKLLGADPPSSFKLPGSRRRSSGSLPASGHAPTTQRWENEPDLKAKAAVAYALGTGHLFERDKTAQNYSIAIRSAVYAVQESAAAGAAVKASALGTLSNIYDLKWQKDHILDDLSDSIDGSKMALELCPEASEGWRAVACDYASHLAQRFDETRNPADIDEAIALTDQVYRGVETDNDRARVALSLSAKLQARAGRSAAPSAGKQRDLDQSVNFMRIALRSMPPGHLDRWRLLLDYSCALYLRGKFTRNRQDLLDAIQQAREALAAVPPLSADREQLARHLADVLEGHYREIEDPRMRDLRAINECIHWTREVKMLYERSDGYRGRSTDQIHRWNSILNLLSTRIFLKYEQTQEIADAVEATRLAEFLVDADGCPLGSWANFPEPSSPGDAGELDAAVQVVEKGGLHAMGSAESVAQHEPFNPLHVAFRGRPHGEPSRGDRPSPPKQTDPNTGYRYWLENQPLQTRPYVYSVAHAAIAFLADSVCLARKILGRPEARVELLCGVVDFVHGVGKILQAAGHAGVGRCWAKAARYVLLYLAASIETDDQVDTVKGWVYNRCDTSRASLLRLFASQLARHGSESAQQLGVALRILVLRRAIQLAPVRSEPLLRARCVADLADAYYEAFWLTGIQECFETAREQSREATRVGFVGSAISRDPKVSLPLIRLLLTRYWLANSLRDVQQCIEMAAETVVSLDSSEQETFVEALYLLALALRARSRRTGARLDLEEALLFARTALSSGPLSKRVLIDLLNVRSAISTDLEDAPGESDGRTGGLSREMQAGVTICRIIEPGVEQRSLALHHLSLAFRARFQNAQDKHSHDSVLDIESAVATERLAIGISARGSIDRARFRISLGRTYVARYRAFGIERDGADAVSEFLKAASPDTGGTHLERITGLSSAASVQATMNRLTDALDSLERAIDLFEKLSPRGMSLDDKQDLLSIVRGVPGDAAAAALLGTRKKGAMRAVSLLEKGRGLIIGTLIEERSEAPQLLRIDRGLHQQFRNLQLRLTAAGEGESLRRVLAHHGEDDYDTLAAADDPRDEMRELLEKIRNLPELRHFLLTPSRKELKEVSQEGAVIMVFNSPDLGKSFAVVATKGKIKAVELPELTSDNIQENLAVLHRVRTLTKEEYFERGRRLIPVLDWLWVAAVRPILDFMGWREGGGSSEPVGVSNLPRAWWIGVGLLAHFPFHAAGCYGGEAPGESAMDLVNSSYVPTIKSLLYAREKTATLPSPAHATACFVSMETTPGYPRLEGVEDEARRIQAAAFPSHPSLSTLVRPTAAEVADQIGHCDVLHLACHGESDLTDPSRSHLVLARADPDGSGVERPDRLFVGDILRRAPSARGAGIAFLRACYTADNPALGLSNEVIHLASAFHLAGFSHVLATLWSTRNSSCGAVSEKFYTYLGQHGHEMSHRNVAVAFHQAVNDLRAESWTNPLLWASFVHVGI